MNILNLDAILCFSPENIKYFSGFTALEPHNEFVSIIMVRESEPVLLTPISEMGGILSTECWVKDHRYFGRYYIDGVKYNVQDEDPIKAIKSILSELHIDDGRIGVEENIIPFRTYEKIRRAIPGATFVGAERGFANLRMIKTDEEVRRIREIVKISEKAYLKALETSGEGVSELEVSKALKHSLIEDGAALAFVEMGSGRRGGLVNAKPTENRMRRGDVLRLDLGTIYRGYCSDISRNAVVGAPTKKQLKIHDALLEGHGRMMDEIKPHVNFSELYKIGMKSVKKTFPNYWRYHLGHGIGLSTHESPYIKMDEEGEFRSGMVLTIEVPFYLAEIGGFNIEDVLLITEDGCESISTIDRSFYIL